MALDPVLYQALRVSFTITWQDCNLTLKLVQIDVPVSLFLFRRKCISRYQEVQFFSRSYLTIFFCIGI